MVLIVTEFSVLPFLAPAFYLKKLAALQTHVDSEGVCRQNTDYTCGPAAAVTALRRLGFPAEEGELAVRCRTNPFSGTAPDVLCEVLRERYGPLGLRCQYRPFASIDELKQAGLTLAVVKFGWLVDHYVTVLEVTDQAVVVGDPLAGRVTLSHQEFAARWRKVGVVLGRDAFSTAPPQPRRQRN
jgi:ABC-type bacteriocin/lantibiotic exporter with double-glycine peptidase domain